MKFRAVFFDLDDTLINSQPAWAAALDAVHLRIQLERPALAREEFLLTWETAWRKLMVGVETGDLTLAETRDQRCGALLEALGLPLDLSEEIGQLMAKTYLDGLVKHPDASAMSHFADSVIGIITNGADDCHVDSQRSKLTKFGWQNLPILLISDTFGSRKPDPRIVLEACRLARVNPGEAAFVGDSPTTDIPAGKEAGVFTVQIRRPGVPSDLRTHTPDAVIDSLQELRPLLEAQ